MNERFPTTHSFLRLIGGAKEAKDIKAVQLSLQNCQYLLNTLKTNGKPDNLKALQNYLNLELNKDYVQQNQELKEFVESLIDTLKENLESKPGPKMKI